MVLEFSIAEGEHTVDMSAGSISDRETQSRQRGAYPSMTSTNSNAGRSIGLGLNLFNGSYMYIHHQSILSQSDENKGFHETVFGGV